MTDTATAAATAAATAVPTAAVAARHTMKPYHYYVGSKATLAASIIARFPAPAAFHRYLEPMCGSAAVFFAAQAAGLLAGKRVVLADANPDLIELHVAVQSNPTAVFEAAQTYAAMLAEAADPKACYLKLRELFNGPRRKSAGLQLVLRQATFNSLWRVNRKGALNVPPRAPKQLRALNMPSLDTLVACAHALSGVDIQHLPFDRTGTEYDIGPGDVVYLDPPYFSEGDTGFTDYTAAGFDKRDQLACIVQADRWTAAGAHVIYSNADHPAVEAWLAEHWPAATLHRIAVDRKVAADPKARGQVSELLVHGAPTVPRKSAKQPPATPKPAPAAPNTAPPTLTVVDTPMVAPVPYATHLRANVRVPIDTPLGRMTAFVGGNRVGKSSGLDAVTLALTGKLPGLVHGKDVSAFTPLDEETLFAELTGLVTAGPTEFRAAAGKKLPTREGDEHVLPQISMRGLLDKGTDGARAAIMQRFGQTAEVSTPRGLDEGQLALWREALAAVGKLPGSDMLPALLAWLDSTQRAATTAANAREKEGGSASAEFQTAGVEELPRLRAQRDQALLFTRSASARTQLAALRERLAALSAPAAQVIAEHEAAQVEHAQREASAVARDAQAQEHAEQAATIRAAARGDQEKYERAQEALALVERVLAHAHDAACPFCASTGIDWPARKKTIADLVHSRDAAAMEARVAAARADQAALACRQEARNEREQATQVLARTTHARAKLRADVTDVKARMHAIESTITDTAYDGPVLEQLDQQIRSLEAAQAARHAVESAETAVRELRRRATTAKGLKDEAKKLAAAELRRTKDAAETAVNKYLPVGFRAEINIADTTCEWCIIGNDDRAHNKSTMCGSERALLELALAVAWTEGAPLRVLALDDTTLAMLEPRNLQATLRQIEQMLTQSVINQAFITWPSARIDHADEIPKNWAVVHVGGVA